MTDIRSTDPLRTLAEVTAALYHGSPGFYRRLDEMAGGYPSAGEGSPGNAANGGPTLAAVVNKLSPCKACEKAKRTCPPKHHTDPASRATAEWEAHITAALKEAGKAWAVYAAVVNERIGVDKVADPGCDLCSKVPCGGALCDKPKDGGVYRCETIDAHWCPVYATVEVTEVSKRKGQPDTVRQVKLCSSCFEFNRPSRAGRMPTHAEVLDHVEGRRRRWKAS